jgi:hypothetical protein
MRIQSPLAHDTTLDLSTNAYTIAACARHHAGAIAACARHHAGSIHLCVYNRRLCTTPCWIYPYMCIQSPLVHDTMLDLSTNVYIIAASPRPMLNLSTYTYTIAVRPPHHMEAICDNRAKQHTNSCADIVLLTAANSIMKLI